MKLHGGKYTLLNRSKLDRDREMTLEWLKSQEDKDYVQRVKKAIEADYKLLELQEQLIKKGDGYLYNPSNEEVLLASGYKTTANGWADKIAIPPFHSIKLIERGDAYNFSIYHLTEKK
jgi:hypothetical protein